ncbi:MAG: penicillin-binding transpeptidase domain-containing protein [Acidobacteriota bacterium]
MTERRIKTIRIIAAIWMLAIAAKLVYLQVFRHDWLSERAQRQQMFKIDLTPDRGVIYDCNHNALARSIPVESLYAAPADLKNPAEVARLLAEILDLDREQLLKRLLSDKTAVAVKRKLSDQEAARVRELRLPGLHFAKEMKRVYSDDSIAPHVLGFVDFDERGQAGIERSYEKEIAGQAGRLIVRVDAKRDPYDYAIEESRPGADIHLTINSRIQRHVEMTLAQAVRQNGARAGTIVMIRPATGEILALANYPSFDPNRVSESTGEQRRNRAVENVFEPGSIFKIVTYAGALEEGEIRRNSLIDCGGGVINLPGRVIHDRPFGSITAQQALIKSSNSAAIHIAQRLGEKRLASYIEAFGFARRTGIELPSESRGLLRPVSEWSKISIGAIPIGYEISVNAVQAAAAFATIANGGVWVQPHLVNRITRGEGEELEVISERKPETRRVVSRETADTLKEMLEGVVLQGTGKLAQLGGYRAAGKTGTAEKLNPATKRYSKVLHVASFVGFAPVENPEIACIVSIDEPRGARMGGDVAAPVFSKVVPEALQILGVPTEGNPEAGLAAGSFRRYEILPEIVADANPRSEASREEEIHRTDAANDQTVAASNHDDGVMVPDLSGRSLREAVGLLAGRRLKIKAEGDGMVSSQSPPPGSLVAPDTVCIVRLSKRIKTNSDLPRRAAAGMK